jgi:hypothetical protein
MQRFFFKTLASLNKVLMPRFSKRDLSRLKKWEQALIAYRYWVTKNALE